MNVVSRLLKKWTETSLVIRILIGLVIGAVLGLVCPGQTWIGILGKIFVSALKAIAPILVAFLVISAIAKAKGGLGPQFRTVITLYIVSTFMAAVVAVTWSFLFPVEIRLQDIPAGAGESSPGSIGDVFANLLVNMVTNPVSSIAEGNYIGILFWSVIIGFALKLKASESTINAIGDISEAISTTVRWVIQAAPFGILGLVFSSVADGGLDIFADYGKLLALLVGSMLCTSLIINPLISFAFIRTNPLPLLWKCLRISGLNAFFTRSSAANIPINMALCEQLGLDRDFYSVSIPLGSIINMNGAAVTITVLSLAVANTLGIQVSFPSAVLLSIISTLGACGASGVAGGSLLLIPMACSLFGIPGDVAMQAVAVGFIIGVVQDSVETALNSSADVFFTATAEFHGR